MPRPAGQNRLVPDLFAGPSSTVDDAAPPESRTPAVSAWHFSDADEQAGLLKALDQRYRQLTAGGFDGRWQSIAFEGIEVFRERIGQCVHQSGVAQAGHWTFATATQLSAPAYWNGTSIDETTLICFEPQREFELRTPRLAECVGFTVPEENLRRFLEAHEGAVLASPLAGRSIATSQEARRRPLFDLLLAALQTAEARPEAFASEATHRMLNHALLEALLYAADARDDAAPVRDLSRAPAIARKGREFIDAHVDEPFTVTDLCRAIGCSRRALQYAFEKVFGVNPVAYVRAVRLDGARRDLKNAGPDTTVQAMAARWGFWHLPRFAQSYAAMFGERPSDTLRRARSGRAPH